MKYFFQIFLIIILNPFICFPQISNLIQTDSIYKINRVKSITEFTNGSYIKKKITNFDKTSKIIEILEFDSSNNIYTKMIFEYDIHSKCIRTISYPFIYEDSVSGKKLDVPYVDSNYIFITNYNYDKMNRLTSKVEKKFNGEQYSKNSYSYNPKIEIEQYFDSNKVESESKIFFFENGLMKRQFRHRTNKTEKWDFRYTYKFDNFGKVTETIFDIKYSAISKEYYHKINYPIKETNEYLKNGLLKSFTDFYKSKMTWKHDFEYEYW